MSNLSEYIKAQRNKPEEEAVNNNLSEYIRQQATKAREEQATPQTAGEKSPAVSLGKTDYKAPQQKTVELPSYIENQGLYFEPGTKSRIGYLVDSSAKGLVGGALTAGEALAQDLMGKTGQSRKALYDYTMETAYQPQQAGELNELLKQKKTAEQNERLNTNTLGYKLLESSDADMAKATEGMGATGQFLTGVMGSTLQNAYLIPLAVINPAAATAIMSLSAAGRTTKEQSEKGKALNRSLVRGAIDGTIEYFTEKLPMEAIAKRLTGQGDNIIKFVLQQAYSEAGEEGLSYLAGYAADKLEKDPDAQFSVQELLLNMLAGGLSGAMLGGGTAAIGAVGNTVMDATPPQSPEQPGVQVKEPQAATQQAEETDKAVDFTDSTQATEQPKTKLAEYTATLGDNRSKAEHQLNKVRSDTKTTNAQFIEDNLDAGFVQEGSHYFLEKDGRKTSITKAAYDYANYLLEQDEAQTVAQSVPAQEVPQAETAKDINVPGKDVINTNVGNMVAMSMEDAKQQVRNIGADVSQQEAIKAEAVKKGQGDTIEQIEAFAKRTGVNVHYYNGQLGQKHLGFREGNDIYIDLREKDVMLKTAVHETIHALRSNNSKAYDKLYRQIDALQKNSTRFNVLAEMTGEKYADAGVVDTEANSEEIVAKLSEAIIENPEEFLRKFGKERTFIGAVIDFLKEIKNTIVANFGGAKAEAARVDNALLALEQYLRNEAGETDGGTNLSHNTEDNTATAETEGDVEKYIPDYLEKYGGIAFEKRYGNLTTNERALYNAGKNGDENSAIDFAREIVKLKTVSRFQSYGENVCILPVSKLNGNNKNGRALTNYIASFTKQKVFTGVYQYDAESTKGKSVWDRMKIKHPDFYAVSKDIENDIAGKKFIVVDDNSTSGRTLAGLRSFIEDNGGTVLDYYAATVGQDKSEINRMSKEQWEYIHQNLDAVKQFAESNNIKRDINEKGLTYNEADTLIKKFKETPTYSGNTGSDGQKARGVQQGRRSDEQISGGIESQGRIETERIEDTPKGVSSSFAENNGTVTNKNGDVVAVDNNGSTQFNIRTFEDGGREYLERYLAKQNDLTAEDKADILYSIDSIYDMVKEYNTAMSSEYPSFANWCEAKPAIDDNGNVIMSVIVPNGDYKMNIDVSTVCKKRKALDVVLNKMAESGDLSVYSMSQPDIVKMNQIIKRHGFEVACSMCFVDAKRYRIGNWANSFADMYNSIVETIIPEGSDIVLDQFNYSGAKIKKVKGRKADSVKTTELRWDEVNRISNDKNVKPIMREMAKAIKTNPSMRRMLSGGDLISSKGMDNLKMQNPELYKLTNRHMGTAKPKTSHSETPYTNEILKASGWTPEKAYAVGGVRIQSFSDYMANMFFDYAQIIADLSAKKLPGHGYTKELDFAKIFGVTGLKINMSAMPKAMDIPADVRAELNSLAEAKRKEHPLYKYYQERAGLDARGNYLWADESIDVEEAIKLQNSDGYEKNCGIICVGISDAHIRKLMADDNMKMVIPYHKSGINPVVAKMQNIDLYTDYTNEQNTRYAKSGKKLRKNSFHFDFYADLVQTNDPRTTAENYVRDCESRNYLPKFDRFAYKLDADGNRIKGKDGKFVVDENYYKLLIDFRVYDNAGKYAPQGAIKMSYPQNLDQLVKESLKTSEATAAKMDKGIDALLKDIKKEISIKDSDRVNTKPVYSGNYDIKFDTQASIDIGNEDAKAEGKYKGKSIKEISEGTISESQQRRAKAQERMEQIQQQTAKLVPEKFAKAQAKKAGNDLPESVGAMKSGYHAAIEKYGAFPEGEKATNPVDVPMSVDGEHGVTRGVRTIMEAEATKEDMLADFQKAIAEGDFNYDINRDKDAVDKAVNYIEKYGYKDAYEGWRKKVDNKQTITKDDMTQAQIMYASAVEYGDYDTAMKLATDISIQATKAGQVVQSMRILKKTTPDGRLYYAQKSLEAVQDEVNDKYGDKAPELKVDDKLWENLREAQTDEDIREATAKFNQAIADQLPFDSQNFWIALRYLSMLGNTRTQIRNIASNFVTTGAQEYTNWVQSLIEKGLVKSGKNIEKTSTTKKPTSWQVEQAEADYVKVEPSLYGEGKYKDSNLSTIQKMANPFDFKGKGGKAGEVAGKVLTKWNNATNWAMETGDKWFSAPAYKKYYARYLTANNITTEEQLTDKVRLRARAWATKQAKEAVYRESNAAADAIAKCEKWLRNQKSPVRKGTARVIGGIMPFRNTPLNITKRAFEYSPVGFAVELIKSKDEMDAGQLINSAAKSLSGTSLMILGYFLSQMGLITGGLGKDDKLKEEMGEQSYALTTPWFSYTLDWAGAGIMPLFMGAQIQKGNENNDGFFITLLDALSNASAPVMETSMMTGFMDAWQTASYEDTDAEKATAFIAGSLASYMNQYVPTLFGQIARAVDDTARSNYTESSGIAQIFEKSVSKAKNKIPFLSKFNVPYMDVWGNEVENLGGNPIGRLAYNMLSPGYMEKKSADKVETMLQDVYDTTGENSVLPKNNTKSIDLGEGRKRMTAEQYEKYHKAYGKTAYSLLEKTVNNPRFMSIEDAYKVAVIDKIYEHASRMAARSLGKSQDNTVWERQDALNVGVNPYYLWAEGTSANMSGTKAKEYIDKNCKGLSDLQKKYLYTALTTTKNNPYD